MPAVLVAVLLWPAAASASFLSWLEELSGPGPFTGPVFSAVLACVRDGGEQVLRCDPDGRPGSSTIGVRFGHFYSDARDRRFKDLDDDLPDNHGVVRVQPLSVVYLTRLGPGVEVGAGAGFMRVSGERFEPFTRFLLTPFTASLTPFTLKRNWPRGRWRDVARVLRVDVDAMLVPAGFRGTDFQNARTRFQSGPDILFHAGVVVDLTALVRRGPLLR